MKTLKMLVIVLIAVVTFGQATYAASTFKDVSTKHSNYEDIEWAVSQGLLKGYSDKTFKPNNYLTEAQFAKIFTRYVSPQALKDVTATNETAAVYNFLTSIGLLLNGHTDTSARNKKFTRIQVAKAFYQLYEGKAPSSNTVTIDWMYAQGLTNGKGVSSNKYSDFGSNDLLKRAHISAFFSRYDKMVRDEPLDEGQIVEKLIKNELGNNMELVEYDRIHLTGANEDEYFIYLRDKSASLVDLATNTYIIASHNTTTDTSKILKKWSVQTEFSFLQRESLNNLEQMIIWANTGTDQRLELSVVAANSSGTIFVTPITKTYNSGIFSVEGSNIIIEGDTYRLVNGVLQAE